ncbi:MAG: phosphoribosylanthranilate isomerase [Victivallales bacterium]|nr:phosphoribosylanthranilate isomerase [Victivallales bacterium]
MKPYLKVKICGLTRLEDALAALDAGADYLGFILYAGSPRYIDPDRLRRLTAQLPERCRKVGVFVNADAAFIRQTMTACRLDIAQLHGEETAAWAAELEPTRTWKAFHLRTPADLARATDFPAAMLVIDSSTPQARGGTGIRCDWQLAAAAARQRPIMLAGGIDPDNAVAAARAVNPCGLDLAGGVEAVPGIKDHNRIQELFYRLQQAELR